MPRSGVHSNKVTPASVGDESVCGSLRGGDDYDGHLEEVGRRSLS